MKPATNHDRQLLRQIRLRNVLSFGPETPVLELENLNVLIGPNGAGKSNLIEALALMRATPMPPQTTSNADVRGVLRRGGGVQEWVWKGAKDQPASVELVVSNPRGKQPLRHLFAFRADKQGFRLHDERVENATPYGNQHDAHFYYRFQDGHPVVNTASEKGRKLARETVSLDVSILAQRREPEVYPEITYLADTYETWRIYREWAFGRNTVFREPQRADMRNDRLEEDFSNLGLFLSRLRKTPRAKQAILGGLRDLYDGLTDFEPVVEGGSVQVFFSEGDFSIPATRLSDGTLRYLCLLAILCDPAPPPLICIEEPELGLHPDILPKLADLLVAASERTQLIVTTHSDILVDAMTERPEVVVVCEKHEGQTEMRRLQREDLAAWLDKYRLGQLWIKGQLGGNPLVSTTDTSEKGLETLIVRYMTGTDGLPSATAGPLAAGMPLAAGSGWLAGEAAAYDRAHALDTAQLFAFLQATQPDEFAKLGIADTTDARDMARQKFLARLSGEVGKRGVIDVLRHGVKHGALSFDLFCATPSPGNDRAAALFARNRFSVTRQLRYSLDETRRALDLCLFINGLPVITFELKNSLTKQTVEDAVEQYRLDRDPREKPFDFGRCVVHLAVDDHEVRMCTHLKGKGSWFLPLNQGWNDGAGNPPNPDGMKTDYLWKRLLTPDGVTDVLENYAQIVEEKDPKTGRKKAVQIFPRYHQLDVVRKLLADVARRGVGKRYLIQHSAGSGKSNSIAWLAHQLIGVRKDDRPVFDSIIVITDRRILDRQIEATIKQFAQVGATVGHAEHSGDLRKFIEGGKKIIITTVQKFPFILDEIGDEHRGRSFALVIDEAHSSQGGKTSAALSEALADAEDTINDALQRRMEARKMLTNASYFAFTATPKNKTLEMFGEPVAGADGKTGHRPFHGYTMKQAIQEGFILDVLRCYTPVDSYYRLVKTIDADPEFDTKKARKKLRKYVESHDHAIRLKAEIMADHFHEQVMALNKVGGQARAMVVCSGIERAVQYFHHFRAYLQERKSPYRAIVAFSGEHEHDGVKMTESSMNGFPGGDIADRIQEDPYRFLICADKFQTGYDEPLLHTMYVDKPLAGIKAVQTLSRLNRAHPQKHDVFVLDFMNDAETITAAFADYYRTTLLSEETDPDKLHDLKADLDGHQVYAPEQVENLAALYLAGAGRDRLDAVFDACVATYLARLDEDGQVDFKGKAKAFTRTYDFLASVLPYTSAAWEKLSIFLNFLVPKLPAPKEEDLARGILEAIDMDSYRVEKKAALKVLLADENAEIGPIPVSGGGRKAETELDRLSNILKSFNEQFGTLFADGDRIVRRITEDIAPKVASDQPYQNARQNTPSAARIELDAALMRVIGPLLKDDTEFYKQFVQNESFKRFVTDMVLQLTQA